MPIPVEDLERRLKACREMGVRELHDGQLHVMFDPIPRRASASQQVMSVAARAFADGME